MAMFNQKKEGFEGTTIIAEGVRVQGDFRGEGPMIIDGIVQGTISTVAAIEVGPSAAIEADINAGSMVVAGKIKGNIIAKERLELLSGSHIEGDVVTRTLIISEGAILNGHCAMGKESKEPVRAERAEAVKVKANGHT